MAKVESYLNLLPNRLATLDTVCSCSAIIRRCNHDAESLVAKGLTTEFLPIVTSINCTILFKVFLSQDWFSGRCIPNMSNT